MTGCTNEATVNSQHHGNYCDLCWTGWTGGVDELVERKEDEARESVERKEEALFCADCGTAFPNHRDDKLRCNDCWNKWRASQKTSAPGLRKPFYEASDGIYSLCNEIQTMKGDSELGRLSAVLLRSLHELQDHMNEKYLWD